MKRISKFLLDLFGWKVSCTVPDYPKCIICVAPHTSNWDFILAELTYWSLGRFAGFLMKKSWFFFPLNLAFNALGGIPVDRKRSTSITDTLIERFRNSSRLSIAITPEGTRKKVTEWRTGFLRIAYGANVPIVLGALDAANKRILLEKTFTATGDIDADMRAIKDYYKQFEGLRKGCFSAE